MILLNIANQIIKEVQGGVHTVESKFSVEYIYSLIHSYRASLIRAQFSRSKRIHPLWTQQFFPEFDADLQDDDCVRKFQVPASIIMNEQTNGYLYIGDVTGNCAYKQLNSRAELSTYNQHRVSNKGVRIIYSDGVLEVYGNTDISAIRVDGVFADPTQIPTFNADIDNYPLDDDTINQMKAMIVKSELGMEAQTPADFKQDQLDITAAQSK